MRQREKRTHKEIEREREKPCKIQHLYSNNCLPPIYTNVFHNEGIRGEM